MSTAGVTVPSRLSRIWSWVRGKTESLSDLRDLVLLTAGACYGVGYLVWSFHAWHRNLGLLPALRFQYLIGGAIPILFVLLVCGLLWGLFRLRDRIADWLDPRVRVKRLVPKMFLFLIFASAAVLAVSTRIWQEPPEIYPLTSLKIASWASFVVLSILAPPPAKKTASRNLPRRMSDFYEASLLKFIRRFAVIYSVLVSVIAALGGIVWFVLEAYPRIPQELGGVSPRRAVIYLAPENQVAPEVLATLNGRDGRPSDHLQEEAPTPAREGAPPRTPTEESGSLLEATNLEVDVYFADSNVLLVKPVGEERPFRSPTYEIRRQSVAAISWQ